MIRSLPASAVLTALLEALERAGLGCTVVIDHGDRIERAYANEPLAKIFGVDLEAMRARPPMDFLSPRERERLAALRAPLGERGPGPLLVETEIVRPDGSSVPVEVGLAYVPLEGARATFVFVRDVSAKAKMEAALRESEERFRRLAEASPDSITVYSNGRYTYANPTALKHLGLSSLDDLATVDPWRLVPPERRAAVAEHTARFKRGEPVPPLQHRLERPGGEEQILESSLSFTTVAGADALISYTRDITDRVRLQAELMKQDRLASVGMLAAGVAHELNNPLTSLAMQARSLRDDADRHGFSPDVRQALAQMDDAAGRMRSIIADLLFMARPVEQPQAHVDVAQIITSTVALLRAGTSGCPPISVEVGELPAIHGYASKLGQVFLNVMNNAIQAVDALPEGAVTVCARFVEGAITVVVGDNGNGMPSDILRRVPQPFFTTKPNGTGLGLWVSKTLMANHGGSLEIASTEGMGTTVTMRVPVDV